MELKKLHHVLSEIAQSINSSQDAMESCIFHDTNLDSTYDSTADWEGDTLDDEDTQYSYDKIDQLTSNSHFSDSEDISQSTNKEPPKIEKDSPKIDRELPKSKKKKTNTSTAEKKKKLRRSKSAKKMKLSHSAAPIKRQSSIDAELKNELNQLDKEQLLELALKLKEEESDKSTENLSASKQTVTVEKPPPTSPTETGGMSKKLKHRIPSKTRLRIAPLSSST